MRNILLTFLTMSMSSLSFAQDNKSTVDRALEATNGLLKLFEKKPEGDGVTARPMEKSSTPLTDLAIGKIVVTNSTGKRVSFSLKSNTGESTFQKTIVLGIDDKEGLNNLLVGSYTYAAKFEDGTVVKSGEFEITKEIALVEKTIK